MMRKNLFFLLTMLMLFDIAIGQTVKIMSFNIRYDNPADSVYNWRYRKTMAADVVKYSDVDIVGMQEVLYNQLVDLDSMLIDYSYVGEGRDGGKKGEYCPIFFKKKRFTVEESSTFWLSENPEAKGVRGWDAACNRIVTWAKVFDKKTNKSFYFFNTHLDHQGTISRIKSAELIIKKITEIAGNDFVVLTGDFNSLEKGAVYQLFTYWDNPVKLKDSRSLCSNTLFGPECTFIDFAPNLSSNILIDYIFVKDDVEVIWHSIITLNKNGFYPSDHLPVFTEVLMKHSRQ
ncbi:MAG: endonuclease/exonuclease/phosphatase family protein [Bacteroidota bacterium]|nr:endonuclease/exonuclease/phosphatase family protein [Bacteroidota bacterium]